VVLLGAVGLIDLSRYDHFGRFKLSWSLSKGTRPRQRGQNGTSCSGLSTDDRALLTSQSAIMRSSLQVRPLSGLPARYGFIARYPNHQFATCSRQYATQSSLGGSSTSPRKQITVASDDGRVRWGELSPREKAARATQQSINFAVIIVGAVMTVRICPCYGRPFVCFLLTVAADGRLLPIIHQCLLVAEQNEPFQSRRRPNQG
jgi:hypothetical protein